MYPCEVLYRGLGHSQTLIGHQVCGPNWILDITLLVGCCWKAPVFLIRPRCDGPIALALHLQLKVGGHRHKCFGDSGL